jgi:dihydroxycyclohexadiene carboxylate dehydrogenase
VDRSEIVHEVSEKLSGEGAETVSLTADLEEYGDCSTVTAQAQERLGRIDILINNVGARSTTFEPPVAKLAARRRATRCRRSSTPSKPTGANELGD